MKIAYFDCFNGASGDMILGALVDAGLGADGLREEVARLGLSDFELVIEPVKKQGFAATKVDVRLTGKPGHRHLKHIVEILDRAALTDSVRDKARAIFTRIAEVEAAAHRSTIEKVHFHEVGAVDAIVDIVGAVAGLERLGIERVECSAIPVGSGTVRCDHGIMPVPAPATEALLSGVPIAASDEPGELTTPTGAAILTTLATRFGPLPTMTLYRAGYGAGTRDGVTRPNLLRLLIGETAGDAAETDEVVVLETNLDDVSGQLVGHAIDRALAAGALDAFATPIMMKKGRPAFLLSLIVAPTEADALERLLFALTPTFGVRRHSCRRRKLDREHQTVSTRFGPLRVKVGKQGGKVLSASPEFADCAAAAEKAGVALREVMEAAVAAWRAAGGRTE